MKMYLFRLLGFGKLPDRDRRDLEAEHIVLSYECVAGSVTYRNYRAPGRVFLGRRRWFLGSLAVTKRRFVAYVFSRRLFSIPLEDPSLAKWQVTVEDGKRLCLAAEASDISADQSGRIEFRFSVPEAGPIAAFLSRGAP